MRNLMILFMWVAVWAGCSPSAQKSADRQPDTLKAANYVYSVEGMTCTGCERTISDAVHKLEGVMEVKADYQTGRVEVFFDTTFVDAPAISKVIEEKGYKVKACEKHPKL